MKILPVVAIITALWCTRLLGSPIEWVVETKDDLEALGAKVHIVFTPGKEPGGQGLATFEVDWTGEKQAPDIHHRRLNLLIFDPKLPLGSQDQFGPVGSRFTIQLGERRGWGMRIHTEFLASEVELESTVLAFWQGGAGEFGWETVHYLVLRRAVDKFPAQRDPFAKPIKPNKTQMATPRNPPD